jgi:pimeloyl-ACP methyl ester carboxylesterase
MLEGDAVPFADLGEVQLFFTDDGGGDPPVLLVHGYTCDSHDWSWQIPHFVEKHRVIAVDLRGHGRSSAPPQGYTAERFAADLAALLKSLGVPPVVAMGHSLGGPVVSALAVEHPDLVAGLVCVDPGYLLPDETGAMADTILPALNESDDPALIVQQMFQAFEAPAWDPMRRTWQIRRVAGVPPHVLQQTLGEVLKGMALFSVSEPYLKRRSCPVLSFYADPARVAIETAVFADDRSRAIGWEGSGHWLHQERPAEFNALVEGWIASLELG